MSAKEKFFARWSRRKRASARAAAAPREPPAVAATQAPQNPPSGRPASPAPSPPDLPALPPIASIGADSDVRAFLAPEVPAELTRAALRRAWSTDPAIRDFVGLSENSWDFTAPDGIPGFGSIGADEVRKLLAQATGERQAPEASAPEQSPDSSATSPAAQNPGDRGPQQALPEPGQPPVSIAPDDAAAHHAEKGADGRKTPES